MNVYYIPRKRSRLTKHALREKILTLEESPLRLTPHWKNNDICKAFLYVEEPEKLRKMGSEKKELVIDLVISGKLKSKLYIKDRKLCKSF